MALMTLLSLAAVVTVCVAAPGEYLTAAANDDTAFALRRYLTQEVGYILCYKICTLYNDVVYTN